ncbi:MAG: hypothetical protein GXY34_01610 [Syntrophomonadaceae bacterium]|nr:hypothetical protein [Syntrophomonadaceae bacterium]
MKSKPAKRIFIMLVCFVMMVTIIPRAKTIWELNGRKQQLVMEKNQVQRLNQQLKEQLIESKKPETVERIAREKLKMVKEGETYVIEVSAD